MSEPSLSQIADLFHLGGPAQDEPSPPFKEGKTPEECLELGRRHLEGGDVAGALRHFHQAVELRGEATAAELTAIADAHAYADEPSKALRQYRKAAKASPDEVEPLVGAAILYRQEGRFRDAVRELEGAIEKEPGNHFLYLKLAELLREMGERSRALQAVKKAIYIKPDESHYHFIAAEIERSRGEFESALAYYRSAIELSPGEDYLYLRVAGAFWLADKRIEAIKAIRLASDLDPEKNVYHGLLAALLERNGDLEEAAQESERASLMDRYDQDIVDRFLREARIV